MLDIGGAEAEHRKIKTGMANSTDQSVGIQTGEISQFCNTTEQREFKETHYETHEGQADQRRGAKDRPFSAWRRDREHEQSREDSMWLGYE